MENIIKTKLTQYVETNNIINDEQAGFRAKKCTNDKLFQLTQIATQAKNRKQACASVFMDVENAFDKVWHNGLLRTMDQHYIPHIFQRFISSFLSNRHTYFQIDNTTSKHIKINHGVPQGSSLNPTLFIIYAANLPKPPPTVHISQFADDIKTFSSSKNIPQLQTKLQVTKQNSSLLWKVQDQLKRKQNNRADHYWTSTQIHQGIHPSTPNTQETNTNH